MSSSFEYMDKNLSSLIKGKKFVSIEHIDDDACVKILFSDNSYFVVEGMPDKKCRSRAIPVFHFYDTNHDPVDYFLSDFSGS